MPKTKYVLPGLLGLDFVLRLLVALRPLQYIDGFAIPDDAYLCLTIARNIAHGLGPFYGLAHTNGFQPLYVLLVTPIYLLFPDQLIAPAHLALLVLAAFDTLTLYVLYRLVALNSKSSATPVLAGLAWVLNPYVMRMTANGMETAVAMFFVASTFYYYRRFGERLTRGDAPRLLVGLGLLFGLASLARIDNLILAGLLALVMIHGDWRIGRTLSQGTRKYTFIGAGALVVLVPWMIYSRHYTGDVLPISGPAVRYMSLAEINHHPTVSWHLGNLRWALRTVVEQNGPILALTALLVLGILVARKRAALRVIWGGLKTHSVVLMYCTLIFLSYVFVIIGKWFIARYLYPIALLAILYFATFADIALGQLSSARAKAYCLSATGAFLLAACLLNPSSAQLYLSKDSTTLGYMNLGLWARKNIPDGTRIGSSQTGALGYFAPNLTVVNLDGVVNKECYRSLVEKRNIEYIRRVGIDYVVGWRENIDFIRKESAHIAPDDLILVGPIPGFTSWEKEWYLYRVP